MNGEYFYEEFKESLRYIVGTWMPERHVKIYCEEGFLSWSTAAGLRL